MRDDVAEGLLTFTTNFSYAWTHEAHIEDVIRTSLGTAFLVKHNKALDLLLPGRLHPHSNLAGGSTKTTNMRILHWQHTKFSLNMDGHSGTHGSQTLYFPRGFSNQYT